MEELASHGYFVFSLAHPYDLQFTMYPDGRIAAQGEERLKMFLQEDQNAPLLNDVYEKYKASRTLLDKRALMKELLSHAPTIASGVRLWTADTVFVLNQLQALNDIRGSSVFAGKLDLTRLGLFGESLGGATAGQTCVQDDRCKACLSLDSTPYGDLIDQESINLWKLHHGSEF